VAWTELRFTVTTPMFAGRGETRADGFRVPELRGALRYWFRALAGPLAGNDIRLLASLEGSVFGSAAGERGKPSPVRVRLNANLPPIESARSGDPLAPEWLQPPDQYPDPRRPLVNGLGYLLGPALFQPTPRGQPDRVGRSYIPPGQPGEFEGELGITPGPYGDVLACCLWTLATFGGLGARIRRGFGGIAFDPAGLRALSPRLAQELDPNGNRLSWTIYQRGLRDKVQELFQSVLKEQFDKELSAGQPEADGTRARYPQLTKGTYKTQVARQLWPTWDAALHDVGTALRAARATVHRPGKPRFAQWVTEEYDQLIVPWLRDAAPPVTDNGSPPGFPLGAFGLPIVFKSHARVEVDQLRRASPLWIRPLRAGEGRWTVLYLVFSAEFLPKGARPVIVGSGNPAPLSIDDDLVDARLRSWLEEAP